MPSLPNPTLSSETLKWPVYKIYSSGCTASHLAHQVFHESNFNRGLENRWRSKCCSLCTKSLGSGSTKSCEKGWSSDIGYDLWVNIGSEFLRLRNGVTKVFKEKYRRNEAVEQQNLQSQICNFNLGSTRCLSPENTDNDTKKSKWLSHHSRLYSHQPRPSAKPKQQCDRRLIAPRCLRWTWGPPSSLISCNQIGYGSQLKYELTHLSDHFLYKTISFWWSIVFVHQSSVAGRLQTTSAQKLHVFLPAFSFPMWAGWYVGMVQRGNTSS